MPGHQCDMPFAVNGDEFLGIEFGAVEVAASYSVTEDNQLA